MDTIDKPKIKFEPLKTHQTYELKDGTRVSGASTICKLCDTSEHLIAWAWRMGCEGKDYKKVRDTAASIGTLAHFAAECFVKGQEADLSEFSAEMIDKATNSFVKFADWYESNKFTLVASEIQLVSERYRFGGTIDMLVTDANGKLVLADLKTSSGIFYGMRCQVAAYEVLAKENGYAIDRVLLCRIGKEIEADFDVNEIFDRSKYWAAFQAAVTLHSAINRMKS